MGAVVAIKSNDRVYIATDKMKKRLDLYWRTKAEFNFKIHKLKNGIIIGAVGPLVQAQRLFLNESWFTTPKGVPFDKRFIATSIIPKYIEYLEEFNILESRDDDESDYPHIEGSFIIVNGSDIFLIDSKFGVYIMKDTAIITTDGQGYVFETLERVLDKSDPEKFLVDIFAKAANVLGDMLPEIVLVDTVNTEFRFLGGSK